MLTKLIAIVGPTAVGKTAVAIELAKHIGGEIVSADSMLIYKGMDIGTAKPTEKERQGIPHHLIDIVEPWESFSVAEYQALAEKAIAGVAARGKWPILAGGTGLYVQSVIDPYDFTEIVTQPEFRQEMNLRVEREGSIALHRELAAVDPIAAAKIHPNDPRRIIRALEVFHFTGRPISSYWELHKKLPPKYDLLYIGLTMERSALYRRVERRVDQMIAQGLVEEVKSLLDAGVAPGSTAMQGLGYKEIVQYLQGQVDLETAVYILKRDTRHFAKRQLTWFRRDRRINWLEVAENSPVSEIMAKIVNLMQEKWLSSRIQ